MFRALAGVALAKKTGVQGAIEKLLPRKIRKIRRSRSSVRNALVLGLATPSSRPGSSRVTNPAQQASSLFIRALLGAELGRAEDARRDFARARAQLKLALGDKPGHDRGELWAQTSQAETRQREAEALFQAKGIPLPEPDAK